MKGLVAGALSATVSATDLKLSWEDCGDATTHVKIQSFSPSTITLGQSSTMVGTGSLDEDVAGATFQLDMTGVIGKLLSCSGDAATSKACNLPFGVGQLTFDAMSFPIKKGQSEVKVDIKLSEHLPASLAKTTTVCQASTKSGDKLFCIKITSAPASDQEHFAPANASIVV